MKNKIKSVILDSGRLLNISKHFQSKLVVSLNATNIDLDDACGLR